MKTCNKCGETKALEDFHRSKKTPSGRVAWCKTCKQKYHAERKAGKSKTAGRFSWVKPPNRCVYHQCEQEKHPQALLGHCAEHNQILTEYRMPKRGKRCVQCQKPSLSKHCLACAQKKKSRNPASKIYI